MRSAGVRWGQLLLCSPVIDLQQRQVGLCGDLLLLILSGIRVLWGQRSEVNEDPLVSSMDGLLLLNDYYWTPGCQDGRATMLRREIILC